MKRIFEIDPLECPRCKGQMRILAFLTDERAIVVHTPGHTPEHISFLITDRGGGADEPIALATGDFLFVGDVGRPDLLESAAGFKDVMAPSARTLQVSLRDRLAPFGDFLQILPAHGAGSACGKSLGAVPTSTLGYERRFNRALKLAHTPGDDFVTDILHGQPNPPLYFATMKRVNRDGVAVTGGAPLGRRLTVDEVIALRRNSAVRILDLRMERGEFDAGHVAGAIAAPLRSSFFAMAAGSFLREDTPIVLVLESAADVDRAARQLYRIGLDGLQGWITVADAQVGGLMTAVTNRVKFAEFDPQKAAAEGAIIDVRTTAEFEDKHLAGALSMPYTRLKEHLPEIPRNRTLFVHCASGKRASLATSFLVAEGFNAVHIDGMFDTCGVECR
jgi:hydroxyacylglutathione hydrolase